MIKIEFHVHTIKSKDSMLIKYLMLLMCKIKKIDCLAVTDHNEIDYALKNKMFFKKNGVEIIVGEEVFTTDGEIIGLFLNKKIEPNLSVKDTIKKIKEQGGLVYIPHPYDLKRKKTVLKEEFIKEIKDEIDFIEKYNGRNVSSDFSKKQEEIANKYNLRKIVGSDAHTFYELGRNYCLVDSIDKESLLKSIENGIFVESKCINFAHINTKFVKLLKMIIKGDVYGIIRIVKKRFNKNR